MPELIAAKVAQAMTGIRDKRTWRKFVNANPQIQCRLPGLHRPKYRRIELEKLLRGRQD